MLRFYKPKRGDSALSTGDIVLDRVGTMPSQSAANGLTRVENVVSRNLMKYIVTGQDMEAFLRQRFSEYPNYNFELKVRRSPSVEFYAE